MVIFVDWPQITFYREWRLTENDDGSKITMGWKWRFIENFGLSKLTIHREWRWPKITKDRKWRLTENDDKPKMPIDRKLTIRRKLTIDRKLKKKKLLRTLSLANGLRDLSLDSWRIWPPWIEINAVSPPNWIRIWLKYIWKKLLEFFRI